MTLVELQRQAQHFLKEIFDKMAKEEISLEKKWPIDHICYRTVSLENYEKLKLEFSKFSELLIESDVNGRPIATYKLAEPLSFNEYKISVVELPAPKVGKVVVEGFEHIEIVCDVAFEEIKKRYPHCRYDESGLKKSFNKELEIELAPYAIKFHHLSLEEVIEIEKKEIQ